MGDTSQYHYQSARLVIFLMEQDITIIFEQILKASQSIDIAESEFKRMMYEDAEMRSRYKAWCAEQEVSEKRGFVDYCMERID